jgi:DNA transformation protein
MAVKPGYLDYVLEQLASLPALRPNRMFGGIGLYSDGIFFGLIDDDTLFFKTNDSNIAPYRERNMPRFMPFPDRPEAVLGYHQVPADVIEDAETLVAWARQSIQVQLALQAEKPQRAAKGKKKANAARKQTGTRNATPARRAPAATKPKPNAKKRKSGAIRATTRKRARR